MADEAIFSVPALASTWSNAPAATTRPIPKLELQLTSDCCPLPSNEWQHLGGSASNSAVYDFGVALADELGCEVKGWGLRRTGEETTGLRRSGWKETSLEAYAKSQTSDVGDIGSVSVGQDSCQRTRKKWKPGTVIVNPTVSRPGGGEVAGQESGSGTVVPSEPGLDELAGQESETKGNVVTGTKRKTREGGKARDAETE